MTEPAASALALEHLAEIAAGSMSRVDLCRVVEGQRAGELVAVKRLLPHIAQDAALSAMFLDEARVTASLRHPNVVEVAGWGHDAQGPYLAVELVQGVSLARLMKTVLETGEAFSERMVVFVAARVCRGLEAAHGLRSAEGELLQLVHRDLSPGNVLVGFDGNVKITDFGLAKAKQRVSKTLTGAHTVDVAYMSPEQARGGVELDGRSDLFSLGVLMFELLAGRRPWSAASDLETLRVAATEPPADLFKLRPKIDPELVRVVTRCLEKEPSARFQSAAEVGQQLEDWLRIHGYAQDAESALGRFVRRNAMRQMRWFERAAAGELSLAQGTTRPRAPSPRAPSYPSQSSLQLAALKRTATTASGSPRARLRSRRRQDSQATDVTDPEVLDAALGTALPRVLDKPNADAYAVDEVPTLIQMHGPAVSTGTLGSSHPSSAGAGSSLAGAVDPNAGPGGSDAHPRLDQALADLESEDAPTLQVKLRTTKRHALAALSTGGAPIPGRASGPGASAGRGSGTAVPLGVPFSEPTPSAIVSGVRPSDGGGGRDPGPLSLAIGDATVTEETLLAEADRLALAALQLDEEAAAAAAMAARKTEQAQQANEAARLAAEAVRVAATSGLAAGVRRLHEALAIEGRAPDSARLDPLFAATHEARGEASADMQAERDDAAAARSTALDGAAAPPRQRMGAIGIRAWVGTGLAFLMLAAVVAFVAFRAGCIEPAAAPRMPVFRRAVAE